MLLTWTFTGLEPELRKNTLGVLRTLDSCRKVLIESIPPDWLRLAQIGSDGYQLAVNWAIDWSIVGTGLKAFLYYSPKIWSANLLILGTISVLVSWWPPNEQKISIVLEGLLKFIDVYWRLLCGFSNPQPSDFEKSLEVDFEALIEMADLDRLGRFLDGRQYFFKSVQGSWSPFLS